MPSFAWISQDQFIGHVLARLRRERSRYPAFTLLLGSGFSAPLIPTAGKVVEHDIAWWLYWRQQEQRARVFPERPSNDPDLNEYERTLWSRVHAECDEGFRLKNGLPDLDAENIGQAYRAIMSSRATSGLPDPQSRKRYLRDLCARVGDRINSAHLFLASILRAQEAWAEGESLKCPFCRTIFTTNFDPLLQRSLQLESRLYFMSDRPELLEPPEDDDNEVVHLVYSHGSVHRYLLLNTDEEIADARDRNAVHLVPYFERHGVVVVGYSGWKDTVMTALTQCRSFGGNLYWCDVHEPDKAEEFLSTEARLLLASKRGNAYYVPVHGADELMLSLHKALGLLSAPSVIREPTAQLIANLKSIEIPDIREVSAQAEPLATLKEARDRTISRLTLAHTIFERPELLRLPQADAISEGERRVIDAAILAYWMDSAQERYESGELDEAIKLWTKVLDEGSALVSSAQRGEALLGRGFAYDKQGFQGPGIADYNTVLNLPDVPDTTRHSAHLLRAVAFGAKNEPQNALADLSTLLGTANLPTDQRVTGHFLRWIAQIQRGSHEQGAKEFVAFIKTQDKQAQSFLISLLLTLMNDLMEEEGATVGSCAWFILIVCAATMAIGNREFSLEGYTLLIEEPDVSARERAVALAGRASVLAEQGAIPEAIKDYRALLKIPDAPLELRTFALRAVRTMDQEPSTFYRLRAAAADPDKPDEDRQGPEDRPPRRSRTARCR